MTTRRRNPRYTADWTRRQDLDYRAFERAAKLDDIPIADTATYRAGFYAALGYVRRAGKRKAGAA